MKRYLTYVSTPEAVWYKEIPCSWRSTKMREIFSERNEKVSDKNFAALSVGKMGVVPQLETAVKTDNGDNRKLVKEGDFAINSRSDRKGAGGISDYDGSVSLIITVLKPHNEINRRFYHYLLRSYYFSEEFYRNGQGLVSDLWSTKWDKMRNIYLPVPPRAEQDQIVRFLDWKVSQIDRLIAGYQKEIALLKERRVTIIDRAVTKGIDPEKTVKESGIGWIGKIPYDWDIVPLKRCATLKSGITLGKKYPRNTKLYEYPYLRVANVQNGYVDLTDVATIFVTEEEALRNRLSKGVVLMTEGGDRDKLGRGCVWNGDISPCLHQNHIYAVSTNGELLINKFLEYLTRSNVGREYFDLTAIKTTNLACTNSSKVLSFTIPLPSVNEQELIIEFLDYETMKIQAGIESIEKQISLLGEYRMRLICDAVTGQIDVRDVVIPEGAAAGDAPVFCNDTDEGEVGMDADEY